MDSTVCHGQPCIRGTSVVVTVVLDALAAGRTADEIVQHYPRSRLMASGPPQHTDLDVVLVVVADHLARWMVSLAHAPLTTLRRTAIVEADLTTYGWRNAVVEALHHVGHE